MVIRYFCSTIFFRCFVFLWEIVMKEVPNSVRAFTEFTFFSHGKEYHINRVSLFTTNHTGDEQWYLSFVEAGRSGAIPYVMRPSDIDSVGKININRISSPHPDSPSVGRVYCHFKGNYYKVAVVAYSPFEGRWFVIYEPLYKDAIADSFIRTLEDFTLLVPGDETTVPLFALAA